MMATRTTFTPIPFKQWLEDNRDDLIARHELSDEDDTTCTTCHGEGVIEVECQDCDGSGDVDVPTAQTLYAEQVEQDWKKWQAWHNLEEVKQAVHANMVAGSH
jgi:RecJ-like exonuclease